MSAIQDVTVEGAKAAPPVGVAVSALYGVQWDKIVLALTAIYTVLQIYFLLRDRWWRDRKSKGKARR